MSILIKNARIVDAHGTAATSNDILIEKGIITQISSNIKVKANKVISSENLHVSAGWMDMRCHFGEPGFEDRESIESGIAAAAAGGFTDVCLMPNTLPCIDTAAVLNFVKEKSAKKKVDVHVVGAATVGNNGADMAELFDMHQSGAVFFSDGKKSIQDAAMLKRLLLYVNQFDGLLAQFPMDESLAKGGQMNEGEISTNLGLKSIPQLAETIQLTRDIQILAYTNSRMHLMGISTAESAEIIQEAQKSGLRVSSDVGLMNLILSDAALLDFDSNFKLMPPLRSEKDRKKLVKAFNKGLIDCLSTDHTPRTPEEKVCEFEFASFGSIGLQTAYSLYNQYLAKEVDLHRFVASLTENPRRILGLPPVEIAVGEKAKLTVFDPTISWKFDAESNASLSNNSHFFGKTLQGKVLEIIN